MTHALPCVGRLAPDGRLDRIELGDAPQCLVVPDLRRHGGGDGAALRLGLAMFLVGYLSGLSPSPPILSPFLQGLIETGHIEGRNVSIEYRWAEGRYDRLPAMAADLVARQVAVIAAGPSPAALAAKAATTKIPIVFAIGADPVQAGLVARLNKPDGNLTGSSFFTVGLTTKRFQLLLEVVPKPAIVALLVNPAGENAEFERRVVQAAAAELGRSVQVLSASNEGDIDAAFAALAREGATALLVGNDPFFFTRRSQLAALAARLPDEFVANDEPHPVQKSQPFVALLMPQPP